MLNFFLTLVLLVPPTTLFSCFIYTSEKALRSKLCLPPYISLPVYLCVYGVPITLVSGHLDGPIRSNSLPERRRKSCSSSSWCRRRSVAPRGLGLRETHQHGAASFPTQGKEHFGIEVNPLLELSMESLQTNLEDLSEGGSQYVGHLNFEMISISLLSNYQTEPIFHKCGFER